MSENILDIARRVRELSERATPGPWESHGTVHVRHAGIGSHTHGSLDSDVTARQPSDTQWIAETRTAAPQLAEAVERMAAALRHAADTLNGCECEEAYDTLRELGIPLEAGDE